MYIICVVCGILLISLSGYVIFSDYIIEKRKEKKRKYYYDENIAILRKIMYNYYVTYFVAFE